MAQEPGSRKKPASGNLAAISAEIERLDRELLKALNVRAKRTHELIEADPTSDIARASGQAESRLDDLVARNKGPLGADCIRSIFRELASDVRAQSKTLRVAFLGPAYSYSHVATLERFGSSGELLPVASIAAVFEEVNRGQAQFGVVPLENSTDGRVADTLDMFTRLRVRICGEVPLRIRHYLLGRSPRSEVTEVYSKPQALSQCRNWLQKHLPTARTIEVTSTSTAAQLAQDKPTAAAIASLQAGIHYNLEVLAESIEDNAGNVTRFAVIGADSAPRTGQDKMAAMFEVEHRPGSLADAMNVFKRNRLNLTWIESFPIPRPEGGYLFFIELDGHEADLKVRRALAALGKRALRLEVLGSYPRSQPIG